MEIKISKLTKTFDTRKVLNELNFTLKEGHITCIMGPSGCGKTTLLHILMGLIQPDSGTFTNLNSCRLSAVFQEDRLCKNLSPLSNIRLVCPSSVSKSDMRNALNAIGLSNCINQPVRELSGGMKRRVAIVRALMADPDILFLDEPFKGLDGETKQTVVDFVKEKSQGKTVIMVTHDSSEVKQMEAVTIHLA